MEDRYIPAMNVGTSRPVVTPLKTGPAGHAANMPNSGGVMPFTDFKANSGTKPSASNPTNYGTLPYMNGVANIKPNQSGIMPEMTNKPNMSAMPEMVNKPNMSTMPEMVNKPNIGAMPEMVNKPNMSAMPEMMNKPNMSAMPEMVNKPNMSAMPEMMNKPNMSAMPEMANKPNIGAMPEMANKPNMSTMPYMANENTMKGVESEAGGCGYKNGEQPACAPLSVGYVPFQQKNSPKYNTNDALTRGTLFPGLDLPWMNTVNKSNPYAGTPMGELMALNFVITELNLYLDTHPKDTQALQMLQTINTMYKDGQQRYEKLYGPLTVMDIISGDDYTWINNPWPWEFKAKGGAE